MEAVRMIVQEWMQEEENKEILECISECDDKREVTFDMLKIFDTVRLRLYAFSTFGTQNRMYLKITK